VTAGAKHFRLLARCCAEQPEARGRAGEHDGNFIGGCRSDAASRIDDECRRDWIKLRS